MTCSLCDKPARTRGWCQMHYNRWKRHGDPNVVLREKRLLQLTYRTVHKRLVAQRGKAADYPCVTCGQPAHDWSYRNGGGRDRSYSTDLDDYEPRCRSCHVRLDKPRPLCSIDGCDAPHRSRGMCNKHYLRSKKK